MDPRLNIWIWFVSSTTKQQCSLTIFYVWVYVHVLVYAIRIQVLVMVEHPWKQPTNVRKNVSYVIGGDHGVPVGSVLTALHWLGLFIDESIWFESIQDNPTFNCFDMGCVYWVTDSWILSIELLTMPLCILDSLTFVSRSWSTWFLVLWHDYDYDYAQLSGLVMKHQQVAASMFMEHIQISGKAAE